MDVVYGILLVILGIGIGYLIRFYIKTKRTGNLLFFKILQLFWGLVSVYCIVLIISNGTPFVVANNKVELCSLAVSILFLITGAISHRSQLKRNLWKKLFWLRWYCLFIIRYCHILLMVRVRSCGLYFQDHSWVHVLYIIHIGHFLHNRSEEV